MQMKPNQAHRKGGESTAIPQGQTRKPARAAKPQPPQPPAKLPPPQGVLIYTNSKGATYYQTGPDRFVQRAEKLGVDNVMSGTELMKLLIATSMPECFHARLFAACNPGAITIQLTQEQWQQIGDGLSPVGVQSHKEYVSHVVAKQLARSPLENRMDNAVMNAVYLIDQLTEDKARWLEENGGTYAGDKASGCINVCLDVLNTLMDTWRQYSEPLGKTQAATE